MTTIAWDGKTLATDSRETSGSHLVTDSCQKLYVFNLPCYYSGDKLLACGLGGSSTDTEKVWYYFHSDVFPDLEFDHDACGIIVGMKFVYMLEQGSPYFIKYPRNQKLSDGSGGCFARSAMSLGMSAIDAIKHAIKLDTASGGKVQCVQLSK